MSLLNEQDILHSDDYLLQVKLATLAPYIKLPETWQEYSSTLSRKRRAVLRQALRQIEQDSRCLSFGEYTAASLVSENKVLAHPASTDSIPTSANKEDHVSMGTFAARKTAEIAKNLETVLAIELLCACQALDMRAPSKPSKVTAALLSMVRTRIPFWEEDRMMFKDINMSKDFIHSDRLLNECEKVDVNIL